MFAAGVAGVAAALAITRIYALLRRRNLRQGRPLAQLVGRAQAPRIHRAEWGFVFFSFAFLGALLFARWRAAPVPSVPPQPSRPVAPAPKAPLPPAPEPPAEPDATAPAPSGEATAADQETALAERRWCDQGDRMLSIGQYEMAAQAYWSALHLQPASARARAGWNRARQLAGEETARRQQAEEERLAAQRLAVEDDRPAPAGKALPLSPAPGHAHGSGDWDSEQDARYHSERGDQLLAEGRLHLAVSEYEKALASLPSYAPARAGLERARQRIAAGANAGSSAP